MAGPEEIQIRDLISLSRGEVFRILFSDGEEYDLDISGLWWEDEGEPMQAEDSVVACLRSKRDWKTGQSLVFNLHEIMKISHTKSDVVLFER